MPRTLEADFPGLVSAIEDPAVRALFTFRFLQATEVYAELVDAASWEILVRCGLAPGAEGPGAAELAAARGLPARTLPLLRFLHATLVAGGFLVRDGDRLRPGASAPVPFDALATELATRFPEAAIGAEVLRIVVDESPLFFSGERTGEEILFAVNRLPLWFRYFSNDNVLYCANNLLGAEVLARVLPGEGARLLEVGGGAGSAAEAALRRLGPRVASYRFTELVPTFARRGERAARAAASPTTAVSAARLDMTRPWGEQGVEAGSVDAVYSVNCFHVAPDLSAVLAEAHRALAPGGWVVVSECVRPLSAEQPVYVEMLFDLLESFTTVATDPVTRPTHGFLTVAAWRASLARAGFDEVLVVPDVEALARRYPAFFVAAVAARKA